jgi:hypothetical protein
VLDSPPFRDAWQKWQQHRRDINKLLTETQTREQLAKLADWGRDRAVKALTHSVANGWQGIFEPNTEGNRHGKHTNDIGPGQRYTKGVELGEL